MQPWQIVVHFRDFPADRILRCNTREASEKMYMHTLKQALFVLQGNTRSFNAMVLEQQQMLWEASNSGSRGLFETVGADLRGCEAVKNVPVRLYYRKKNEIVDGPNIADKCDAENSQIKEGNIQKRQTNAITVRCYQKPVQVFNSDSGGSEVLLHDVLIQFLPTVFSRGLMSPRHLRIFVHGINIPLKTPILPLWKSCAHADFFLYIIVFD